MKYRAVFKGDKDDIIGDRTFKSIQEFNRAVKKSNLPKEKLYRLKI